jgi:hypothetical protein
MSFGSDSFGDIVFGTLGLSKVVTVSTNLVIPWTIIESKSISLDVVYDALAGISKSVVVNYDMVNNITTQKSVTVKWNISKTTYKILDISWSIDPSKQTHSGGNEFCLPPVDRTKTFCL